MAKKDDEIAVTQPWIEVNNEVRRLGRIVLWLLRILHSQLKIVSHQIQSDCWENKWCQIASITIKWHLVYASMGKWPCVAVSSLGSCLAFLFGAVNSVSEESLLNFKPHFSLTNVCACSMNCLLVLPPHDLYWRPEVRKALLQSLDIWALFCPLYWLGLSHLMKQVSGV